MPAQRCNAGEQLHVSGRVQWKVPDPLEEPPSRW